MNGPTVKQKNLLLLGGIAGISVGVFVLTFAFIAGNIQTGFVAAVYTGESVRPWIDNVIQNPNLARFSIISLTIGFGAIFVGGFSLFQLIDQPYWQKYLGMSGYSIGVPLAAVNFMERFSLQYQLITLSKYRPELLENIEPLVMLKLQEWQFTGEYFGPFFVVFLGTTFMSWAAVKDGILPKWLFYWAGLCSAFWISYLLFPSFSLAQLGAGPLHMLWFFVTGIVLLRKR